MSLFCCLAPHFVTEPALHIINAVPRAMRTGPRCPRTRGTSWIHACVASVRKLVELCFRLRWRICLWTWKTTLAACRKAAILATPFFRSFPIGGERCTEVVSSYTLLARAALDKVSELSKGTRRPTTAVLQLRISLVDLLGVVLSDISNLLSARLASPRRHGVPFIPGEARSICLLAFGTERIAAQGAHVPIHVEACVGRRKIRATAALLASRVLTLVAPPPRLLSMSCQNFLAQHWAVVAYRLQRETFLTLYTVSFVLSREAHNASSTRRQVQLL